MKPKMLTRSTVAENLGVSVLTPTTLKSITQILESENCLDGSGDLLEDNSYPIPSIILSGGYAEGSGSMTKSTFVSSDSKCWQGGTTTVVTPSSLLPQTILDKQEHDRRKENNINNNNGVHHPAPRPKRQLQRKSVGGRRPSTCNKMGEALSPEEESRLQVRRERNKEAAARCRKRRVDQTNDLLEQVEEHERTKRALEEEIRSLQCTREELQFLLQSHSKTCVVVHPAPRAAVRPNSLPLLSAPPSSKSPAFMDSFIETPTSALNMDSFLTATSTGLTPLANMPTPVIFSPNCSSQQREHEKASCDSFNLVSL